MAFSHLSIAVAFACIGITGCRQAERQTTVLLVGTTSVPEFSNVDEGVDVAKSGQDIAVFGKGADGGEDWGRLVIRFTDGQTLTYRSGAVVSWAPPKATFQSITGEAEVELVAYLFDATVNGDFEPSSMILRRKWRIAPGPFTLEAD